MLGYQKSADLPMTAFACSPLDTSPRHDDNDEVPGKRVANGDRRRNAEGTSRRSSEPIRFRYRTVPPVGFVQVNEEMVSATGFQTADFYANPILLSTITVPKDKPLIASFLSDVPRNGEPITVRWTRRNGSVLVVELRAIPIQTEDQQIVALDVTGRIVRGRQTRGVPMKDADQRLRMALEFSEDGVAILQSRRTGDGRVVDFVWDYANRRALELLGMTENELIGLSISSTFPQVSSAHIVSYLRSARSRWEANESRIPMMKVSEGLAILASPLDDGIVMRVCPSADDDGRSEPVTIPEISERIVDDRLPLNDRLTVVCDGIIEIGADFALLLVRKSSNQPAISVLRTRTSFEKRTELEDIMRRWSGDYERATDSGFGPDDRTSEVTRVNSDDEVGLSIQHEVEQLHLESKVEPSCLCVEPLDGADGLAGVVIFGTSREHPPLSRQQERIAQLLVRPVSNALAVEQLRAETVAGLARRQQFLSTVAQEIKTPLTSIRGYSQILNRYLFRDEPDLNRAQRAANGLQTQIDRFLTLSNDLLDAARIHHGRLNLRLAKADLRSIAFDTADRVSSIFAEAEREIEVDAPEAIAGVWDEARIDQVLFILLSNSVHYSREGPIRLETRRVDDKAVIRVTDEGIGIDHADVENLFNLFERGQSAPKMAEGAGLGLYLAREIVHQHGGQITIRSRPDLGTEVIVELPVTAVSA